MTSTYFCEIEFPLGPLCIRGDGHFITGLFLPQHKGWRGPGWDWQRTETPFAAVREQLAEYFAGRRKQFDVPLKLLGTTFQQRVWQELVQIPFGTTITYGELARRVGQPTASRAVGHANGRNPISILVPCHRVIGASGQLTGYAGGLDKKETLLAWERNAVTVIGLPLPLGEGWGEGWMLDRKGQNPHPNPLPEGEATRGAAAPAGHLPMQNRLKTRSSRSSV